MAKQDTWVITAAGTQTLAQLARAITAAGGTVESQLDQIGLLVVQGSAAQAKVWRTLPGVAAVEADTKVDIGPPGSEPS